MARSFFETKGTVPPGGVWFFQIGDDRYESPIYELALRHTGEIMEKHGISGSASEALAEFMCPHMPSWFCSGDGLSSPVVGADEAKENARSLFVKRLVPVDVIMRRMERCMDCRKHRKDFCLHCHGYDRWISDGFGGRRPVMAADGASGCCTCARTFESAIASVEFSDSDPVWEGAPETCWRYDK